MLTNMLAHSGLPQGCRSAGKRLPGQRFFSIYDSVRYLAVTRRYGKTGCPSRALARTVSSPSARGHDDADPAGDGLQDGEVRKGGADRGLQPPICFGVGAAAKSHHARCRNQ